MSVAPTAPEPRRSGLAVRLLLVGGPIVATIALLGWGLAVDRTTAASTGVGRRAPDFELRSVDGELVRLADLRGKVVVVNFWASWCAPCVREAPALRAVWDRYAGRGDVAMLGVVFEDTADAARGFARRYGVNWPALMDPGSRVAIAFGVTGIPETFVISPDGTIVRRSLGEVTEVEVSAWVRDALEGASDA